MALFFNKKERPNFYGLLIEQMNTAAGAMKLLDEFMADRDAALSERIEACEKEGDRLRKELISQAREAFITPLDRHDLFSLSRYIDDITDEIKDLKDFMTFFTVTPTKSNDRMADMILEAVSFLQDAVSNIHEGDEDEFWDKVMKAKKSENQVKRLYWQNIREVEGLELDSYETTIQLEFSKDLNSLANKVGKAGDKLGDIKMKSLE